MTNEPSLIPPIEYPPIQHYYSFFLGQLISILGSEIVRFSLIWWIAVESESSWYLSLAAFLVYGVKVLISPIAGVFADRWNRKAIIFITDLLQALISLVMISLFLFEHASLWNILVLMGVSSGFAAFQNPTVNAIIPTMVPQNGLDKINSLNYFTTFVMRLIGPMVGALLISLWDITQILWLDCISFIIAIVPLVFISIPHIAKVINSPRERKTRQFWNEFKEGLKIIKLAGILGLALMFPFTNLMETPKNILFPLLILNSYQGGPIILATIITAGQLTGALTSLALSIRKIPNKIPRQKIIVYGLIGIFLASLIMIVPSEISPGDLLGWKIIFLVFGAVLMGFCSPVVNITMTTIVQKLVPPEKLGRVEGVSSALSLSLIPLGTLLTGLIAELIGIRAIIFFSALIAIGGILIFYYASDLSRIDENLSMAST
jgi:DHA3 family macrolide efflux protein-like MFS transporter